MARRQMQSLEQLAEEAEVMDFDHEQDLVAFNLELEPPTRYGFPLELDRVIVDTTSIWESPFERERNGWTRF